MYLSQNKQSIFSDLPLCCLPASEGSQNQIRVSDLLRANQSKQELASSPRQRCLLWLLNSDWRHPSLIWVRPEKCIPHRFPGTLLLITVRTTELRQGLPSLSVKGQLIFQGLQATGSGTTSRLSYSPSTIENTCSVHIPECCIHRFNQHHTEILEKRNALVWNMYRLFLSFHRQ